MPRKEKLLNDIVVSPDERLQQECSLIDVANIGRETKKVAKRMLDDMYAADGCGLAGPQVGVMKQIVVIDVTLEQNKPYVLINPKIITADGPVRTTGEGCLSFPGITVDVERPSHVVVHAYDLKGNLMQYEATEDLMAVCLQHEIDHLHGITMLDHLTPANKIKALQEYQIVLANGARPGEIGE